MRDILDVGTFEDQLVLLRLRLVYCYTFQHLHVSYDLRKMMSGLRYTNWGSQPHLLAQEITDFQRSTTLLDDTVDREMGIHRPHFILEALNPLSAWTGGLKPHTRRTFVTPLIIFEMRLLIVRKQATCFLPPCQTARVTLAELLDLTSRMSMSMCRTFLTRVPRGPLTVMIRDLTVTSTPSGISSSSVEWTSRICSGESVNQYCGTNYAYCGLLNEILRLWCLRWRRACGWAVWLIQLYSADKSPNLVKPKKHVMGVCCHGGV